ncbi:MAG: hypothetical protein AAGA48_13965 [Myxococcota bacterium]
MLASHRTGPSIRHVLLEAEVILLASLVLVTTAVAGAPAQVASIPGANLQRPSWSADGSKLSFEANFFEEKRIELYVGTPFEGAFERIQATKRAASSITEGFRRSTGGQVAHELTWAPTSVGADLYMFSASNEGFDYDLYLAGGTPVAANPGADGGAAWSPDGSSIVFTSARTGEGDLYLIDTSTIEADPRRLTSMPGSSELYVTWSNDGKTLAFVAHTKSGDNIWLLPSVGSKPARLTSWRGNQIRPRFSPTSSKLAFYANHEKPGRFDLYVVEVGSSPKVLVRGVYPDAQGPAWTPDGRHIVYVADDDDAYDPVRAVDVARQSVRTLQTGTVGNTDLAITVRDGQLWLSVVAQGRDNDEVRNFKRLFIWRTSPL